jgi:hypothetical protein
LAPTRRREIAVLKRQWWRAIWRTGSWVLQLRAEQSRAEQSRLQAEQSRATGQAHPSW